MKRQVIGHVVQARGEQNYASLADLLVEHQRRPVSQANGDAGIRRVDLRRVEEPHAGPIACLVDRGMRRVGFAGGEESFGPV